ncbi:sugar phosphate isomerase/epimerase family protein [Aureimonas phyllosphaerae]|uniref:Sugar phosphate isomerase/epimerase n=1 Tax=Aureimonas phyllosphaerae TaxID=1166078 RepID=A0A7W6BT62_9HYPH|nr:sugar phosphate isomerase/epimerase [Aureimonas phyllosphaerae]MBB3936427.1 sugar phosphate isomerase/epimerase [Aureimonas phyllosphaerae]MBB3960709.1 sugar phosphate isomerase/epimerase [Aureimonas phyllosphaerae]SFF30462.1 Sugar phosphate isomerase/epimerase [Aureimonas phyllosphaerae]
MKTIKGPGIFLAQFAGDEAPFNSFDAICGWAAGHGYKGVQIPTWDARLFDLKRASESKDYCDEIAGVAAHHGLAITELSTHLQGQLVAVHPAYDEAFDGFAAPHVRGNPKARQEWATDQVKRALTASRHLGLKAHATFSGALAWPFVYPWPQRPAGLVETAFDELARRWKPILDHADEQGVDVAYEIHPGEDLHDGASYEMFLERTDNHARANLLYDPSHFVLQGLDYLAYIDIYHERIRAFHAKDAEFNPTGRQGVYGGFQSWANRAGRFRSLGDGQVDFSGVFSKLTQYGFDGWAVLEWECALKHSEQGAAEGAPFIAAHIIRVTERAFDDFAAGGADDAANRRMLGLDA